MILSPVCGIHLAPQKRNKPFLIKKQGCRQRKTMTPVLTNILFAAYHRMRSEQMRQTRKSRSLCKCLAYYWWPCKKTPTHSTNKNKKQTNKKINNLLLILNLSELDSVSEYFGKHFSFSSYLFYSQSLSLTLYQSLSVSLPLEYLSINLYTYIHTHTHTTHIYIYIYIYESICVLVHRQMKWKVFLEISREKTRICLNISISTDVEIM